MSNPPVCNVAGPVLFPGQKMSPFAPIPAATDLAGVMRALQVINNNFNTLVRLGNFRDPNDTRDVTGGGLGLKSAGGNFTEKRQSRTEKTERLFNPNDHEQFVDVNQITGLTFVDPQTGRTIVWKL